MKALNRAFSTREKILIFILALILVAAAYYLLIDQPVRETIANAETEEANLEIEFTALQQKLADLKAMEEQMDSLEKNKTGYMASYNNRKAEIRLLNDILKAATSYSISFGEVTRDGDQIRRDVNMQFTTGSYASMKSILSKLAEGPYRCLLSDVSCMSPMGNLKNGPVSVSVSMTFYETMVGSSDTAGLPAEEPAEGEAASSGVGEAITGLVDKVTQ